MPDLITKSIRHFLGISVSKKILMISAISSALTLAMLSSIMLIRDINSFSKRKVEELSSMATIVGSNAEASLTFMDPFTAEEYLNSLQNESEITYAVLFDQQKQMFAKYQRIEENDLPPFPQWTGSKMTDDEVIWVEPIVVSSERIGTLMICSNNLALKQYFRQSLFISSVVFFAGLVIAVLLALGLQPLISKPLVSLSELAHQVSEKKDYSIRANKLFDDEVGSLVESFNFMLETVQEQDEALKASHKDLEGKVAERTAQLSVAVEEAQAASRAKSEFLATMSHELRTPMNAIVGMASILNDSDLDAERRGYINLIRQSSDALLSLVNDVLDYSKIEAGRLEIENEAFDLLGCIESAMNIVAAQVPETEIQLFAGYDPEIPKSINGDMVRIRQILVNLLGNAVKFTEKGYVWLHVELIVKDSNQKWLEFNVSDTGIGIPEERMNRLFQSFSQVDSSTTRKYGGTGLGLAISQRLAEAMGGAISVQSKPGEGSVFSVSIPLHTQNEKLKILDPKPWGKRTTPTIQVKGIEGPFLKSTKNILTYWGANVVDGESGKTPDIIIQGILSESAKQNIELLDNMDRETSTPTLFVTNQSSWTNLRRSTNQPITTIPFHVEDLGANLSAMIGEEAVQENRGSESENLVDSLAKHQVQLRILLVEDNIVNQKVFALMLDKLGIKADNASNGQEAVDAIKEKTYELVFMDYQMPVMDGIEATKQIRAMGNEVQQPWIIGFTANVQKHTVAEMRKVGMDSYISKPVKFPELHKIIDSYAQSLV